MQGDSLKDDSWMDSLKCSLKCSLMDDSLQNSLQNSLHYDSLMDLEKGSMRFDSSPIDGSSFLGSLPGPLGISELQTRHCPPLSPSRPPRSPASPQCWRTPRSAPASRCGFCAGRAAEKSGGKDLPDSIPRSRRDCPIGGTPPRGTGEGTAKEKAGGREMSRGRAARGTQKREASHEKKERSWNADRSRGSCRLCEKRKGLLDCF